MSNCDVISVIFIQKCKMFLFFKIFFFHISFWCSCFVIEIADLCANEMSGQFDRMDF